MNKMIKVSILYEGVMIKDYVLCEENENPIRAEHKIIRKIRKKIYKFETHIKKIHEEKNYSNIQ